MGKPKTRRCKMLIVVMEGGQVVSPLPTCEQPSVYTEEHGWACPRHQQMIARSKEADKTNKAGS